MADQEEKMYESSPVDKEPLNDDSTKKSGSHLHEFIADAYRQQMKDGKMNPTEDIDEERCANFYSRAMKESKRMNSEVQKSYQKMENLHNELGSEIFNQWREEHTTEVLTAQEKAAVDRAHKEINA